MERVCKRIRCSYQLTEVDSDFVGYRVPGVIVTCSRCRHQTGAIGTSPLSLRRCLGAMREECPCGGSNDYEVIGDV